MIHSLKSYLVKVIESQPFLWEKTWDLIHKMRFLLPHDKSYYAIRHFFNKHDNCFFIDIGANTGISALNVRKLNSKIPILSLEPNIMHQERLHKLEHDIPPFTYKIVGVGNKEEELTFYTPVYKSVVLHTYTSCSEQQILNALSANFTSKVYDQIKLVKSQAAIIPLDNLETAPSIIKIDTEGFDYNVLVGAKDTIAKHRPFIMIEMCHSSYQSFEDFFRDNDYSMLKYDHKKDYFSNFDRCDLTKDSGDRNIFAIPREKISRIPLASDYSIAS